MTILPLLLAVQVIVDRNVGAAATPHFRFQNVASPRSDDAAAQATLTLVAGALDSNSAPLDALTDGVLPGEEDQPEKNVFFKPSSWGGRVRMDFGAPIEIAEINSYSWHPDSRAPQVYKIFGNNEGGAPSTKLDPAAAGWTWIASVDTRQKNPDDEGGQYGVSIRGDIGTFRYLLIDAFETGIDEPWDQTFFSEIDVIAAPKNDAERVRAEMLHAWRGYEQYAWGHDELRPMSKTPRDWYDGQSLLMTPVDALDTLIIMGFHDEADRARALIDEKLSFDKDISVQNFEITIRLLGGLLSSYQLTHDAKLLALADDLGTRLLPVFNSPTGMPYRFVNLRTGKTSGAKSNPAEIGTLILEFGTLSRLTNKPVYFEKAKNALVQLYNRRSKIGLVGEEIDVDSGQWTSRVSHIGGGIDSYYEYLLKCAKLFGDRDCQSMWETSIRAVNKYVADGAWYGDVDMDTGKLLHPEFGALQAFFPAVLALGGDVPRAQKLEDSCFRMWQLHGIEPEAIDYRAMKVLEAGYPLRPEIVESAYYLHHDTHDERYAAMGRTFFNDIVKYCRTDNGYTTLKSVVTKEQGDWMPSFFLAETLKYFYLLFTDSDLLDHAVFNTEAHPLK